MFYTYYADAFISIMLGWIHSLTDWLWRLISSGSSSGFLSWFSAHWIKLVLVMIAAGVVIDWLVWLLRWRPYWVWFGKKQRIIDDTDLKSVSFDTHEDRNIENNDSLFEIIDTPKKPSVRKAQSVKKDISKYTVPAKAGNKPHDIDWFE